MAKFLGKGEVIRIYMNNLRLGGKIRDFNYS